MAKTHTGVLRRFGYYPAKIRRSADLHLFHETEGIRYFRHKQGYVVALRWNGAWRHCEKNGTRIRNRSGEVECHGPVTLEKHLMKFHGSKR